MSEWITDRPPSREDAPWCDLVWTWSRNMLVMTYYYNVLPGQAWMVLETPEPYVNKEEHQEAEMNKPSADVMNPSGEFYNSKAAIILGVMNALESSGMHRELDEFLDRSSDVKLSLDGLIGIAGEYVTFARSSQE
jgi:hypothetical protein